MGQGKKKTHVEFINECKLLYGNKFKYLSQYNGADKNIKIMCHVHGIYEQTAKIHLRGHGCPRCIGNVKRTTQEFIDEANIVHNNEYMYTKTSYVSNGKPIIVTCKIHGDFETYPKTHLNGSKCMKCTGRAKPSDEEFIKKSKLIHGMRYDYSKVVYGNNNKVPVTIICQEHGEFTIRPNDHLSGKGCKICSDKSVISKAVLEIENLLDSNGILYEKEKIFDNCKNINHLRYDFYLPTYNLAIEYDGEQHYVVVEHWGGEQKLLQTQHNDQIKNDYCAKNGIDLLRIKYSENHIDVVKRKLNI